MYEDSHLWELKIVIIYIASLIEVTALDRPEACKFSNSNEHLFLLPCGSLSEEKLLCKRRC